MVEDSFALSIGGIYSLLILSLTFAFLLAIRLRMVDNRVTKLYNEAEEEFSSMTSKLRSVKFLEDYSKRLEIKVGERTREIEETKNYLQRLIDTSPVCVISTDLDGRIISFNKHAEKTYGYKESEVIGKNAIILQPKKVSEKLDRRSMNREIYEETLKKDGWEGEIFNVRKNGKVFPIYLRTRKLSDDKGKTIRLMSIAMDITDRKQAEKDLQDSEERYRELFDGSMDGIYTLDRKGRFTSVNRVMEELTGYRKGELLGKRMLDIVDERSQDLSKKRFASLLHGEEPLQIEFKMMTKEGGLIDVEVRSAPIKIDGKIVGVQESVREISFRKTLEFELESLNEELMRYSSQLENSNRLKSLFTDIMRHDILNPIGIIGNITDILREDKKLEDSSELLVIKRNVKKLEEIVRNASDYARLESAEKMKRVNLDLTEVIERIIDDFGPYLKDKEIKVSFKPKGKHIANSSIVIESVFANILSNAIKYSPEGSKIKIGIEGIGKNWKVSFADQGDGILDEYKEAVFDRFTRKDKSGVRGIGLGLAIVKRIVEMHNGRVWVEDNPEGGSIFFVEIPK